MARPKKKETEEKQLAVIAKDLIKANPDLSDVAAVLACLKKDVKSIQQLKDECTDIQEFLDVASKHANIALITAAIEAAIGYDYEEVDQSYEQVPHYSTSGVRTMKDVPNGKKVKKRHSKKNEQLLKFILANRLPQYFSDTKKVEINRKSIEIKADTEEEIRAFAGKLLESLDDRKIIESEFVDEDR